MEHIEFIHQDHFDLHYHRQWATGKISPFIDFCWETNFNALLAYHPKGFTDVLFPNIGYTYIINLGTAFVMELEKSSFEIKNGGFLPRHHYIRCQHTKGNHLFGIKFKVCPVVFEKAINFSEYKDHIFPLSYLIEKQVVDRIKKARTFKDRVSVVFEHYATLLEKHLATLDYVNVVTGIINQCMEENRFDHSINELAQHHGISIRTLQRYFEATTSFSPKLAMQTIRIRQAIKHLTEHPGTFDPASYGYYDHSHFSKNLKRFAGARYYKLFLEHYNNK